MNHENRASTPRQDAPAETETPQASGTVEVCTIELSSAEADYILNQILVHIDEPLQLTGDIFTPVRLYDQIRGLCPAAVAGEYPATPVGRDEDDEPRPLSNKLTRELVRWGMAALSAAPDDDEAPEGDDDAGDGPAKHRRRSRAEGQAEAALPDLAEAIHRGAVAADAMVSNVALGDGELALLRDLALGEVAQQGAGADPLLRRLEARLGALVYGWQGDPEIAADELVTLRELATCRVGQLGDRPEGRAERLVLDGALGTIDVEAEGLVRRAFRAQRSAALAAAGA